MKKGERVCKLHPSLVIEKTFKNDHSDKKMAALRNYTRILSNSRSSLITVIQCHKLQNRFSSYFPIDDNLYGLTDEQKQVRARVDLCMATSCFMNLILSGEVFEVKGSWHRAALVSLDFS